MATSSTASNRRKLSSSETKGEEEESKRRRQSLGREGKARQELWTCPNILLGSCRNEVQEGDDESVIMKKLRYLEEKKIPYWHDIGTCNLSCGLPEDLVGEIFSSSGLKTRSLLRELNKTVRSSLPLEMLVESKEEKEKRMIFNNLLKSCDDNNKLMDSLEHIDYLVPGAHKKSLEIQNNILKLSNYQDELLSGNWIDREMIINLLKATINKKCQVLAQKIIQMLRTTGKYNLLTDNDWFEFIKNSIDSGVIWGYFFSYFYNFLLNTVDPLIVEKFFSSNSGTEYIQKLTNVLNSSTLAVPFITLEYLLLSSPTALHQYILSSDAKSSNQSIIQNIALYLKELIRRNYRQVSDPLYPNHVPALTNRGVYERDFDILMDLIPRLMIERDENLNWPSFPNFPSLTDERDRDNILEVEEEENEENEENEE